MTLTFTPKEGRREILCLYNEGELWREVHTAVFGKFPKLPPPAQFPEYEKGRVRLYLTRKLASRSYSSFELTQHLKERLISSVLIEELLQEFSHYLDDDGWIERFIEIHKKKAGPQAIAFKLRRKGIPEKAYLPFLQLAGSNQKEQIQNLLTSARYKKFDLSQWKDKQKVVASLIRKGFDCESVREAIEHEKKFTG